MNRPLWSALVAVAALLALWQAVSWLTDVPHYLLPTPWEVGRAGWRDRAKLAAALWISGREAAGALMAAAAAAALTATAAVRWRAAGRWLLPAATLAQTVPIIAFAPLILNWVGSGAGAVTVIAALIGFFPILVNTTRGLLDVPGELLDLFATRAARPAQVLWKLRWPNALPAFFTGLRIAAGLAVVGAITGELFAGSANMGLGGLGYSLSYANSQLQTDYLFALVAVSSLLGLLLYGAVAACEKLCVGHWHRKYRARRPSDNV